MTIHRKFTTYPARCRHHINKATGDWCRPEWLYDTPEQAAYDVMILLRLGAMVVVEVEADDATVDARGCWRLKVSWETAVVWVTLGPREEELGGGRP